MSLIGTFAIGAALFFGSIGTRYALSFIVPPTDNAERQWAENNERARIAMRDMLKEEGWTTADIAKARQNAELRKRAMEVIQRKGEWPKKKIEELLN